MKTIITLAAVAFAITTGAAFADESPRAKEYPYKNRPAATASFLGSNAQSFQGSNAQSVQGTTQAQGGYARQLHNSYYDGQHGGQR